MSRSRQNVSARPRVALLTLLPMHGCGLGPTCHHCLHSNEDERHTYFYNLLRGVAGSELVIREDMALAAIRAGSAEEFSPYEMQQLLRRCEEECEIMRSRGNIYFV